MDEELTDAINQLRASIDRQNQQQEETNGLLRSLIDALQNTGQATADLGVQIGDLTMKIRRADAV